MAETHVISALRAKRAEVSGYIHDLEKKVRHMCVNLSHIDATIRVFSPNLNPDDIAVVERHATPFEVTSVRSGNDRENVRF